jgi:transcriptional regulator
LVGHTARANPHWHLLRGTSASLGADVKAIFQGPQSYITPQWYAENDVPTWNYATVHIRGRASLIEDPKGIKTCLEKLVSQMEAGRKSPWSFWIPGDLAGESLSASIVGFRIEVQNIEAKFKLSQNRPEADRRGVIRGLDAAGDDMSLAVSELMKGRFPPGEL